MLIDANEMRARMIGLKEYCMETHAFSEVYAISKCIEILDELTVANVGPCVHAQYCPHCSANMDEEG